MNDITAWFTGRLPDDWFEAIEIHTDEEEIIVLGSLAEPDLEENASDEDREVAIRARIAGFRKDTKKQRISIARDAESRFGTKVSWGVRVGDYQALFTHVAAPAMTRLRMKERKILDTLIDSGVARSRSEALAWCVRLVGQHEEEWLDELRQALSGVEEVRDRGPR